jgi:hypothetical protein
LEQTLRANNGLAVALPSQFNGSFEEIETRLVLPLALRLQTLSLGLITGSIPTPLETGTFLAHGQLLNNYLYALVTFFVLSLGWNLTPLSINFQGFRTEAPFHNPLFLHRGHYLTFEAGNRT